MHFCPLDTLVDVKGIVSNLLLRITAVEDARESYSLLGVPWVHLCFQAGCRTLKDIATDVGIPLSSALASSAAIQVSRVEYDTACEQLSSAGVPSRLIGRQAGAILRACAASTISL